VENCGKGRELGRLKVKSLKLKVKTPENPDRKNQNPRMRAIQRQRADLRTLSTLPGTRLERLKGDRNDQYSIRVNDQWRICFVWRDVHGYEVEMVDYH
jgi:plasmid maintenance system killer protein